LRLSEQIGADGGRLSYTEALSSGRSTEAGLLTAIKYCFVLRRIERQALPSTLTRRQFASGSAAIIAGGAVEGLIGAAIARGRPERFTRPLPILPLIDATKQGNAVNLKVASGKHPFVGGKPVRCYGYSGHVLGPAIRLRRGDEVEMTVEDELDIDTTVHWHGLLVPGDVDGGPHQVIKSDSTWRPRLKIDQPASTLWFHSHQHHELQSARCRLFGGRTFGFSVGFDAPPRFNTDRSYAPTTDVKTTSNTIKTQAASIPKESVDHEPHFSSPGLSRVYAMTGLNNSAVSLARNQ